MSGEKEYILKILRVIANKKSAGIDRLPGRFFGMMPIF